MRQVACVVLVVLLAVVTPAAASNAAEPGPNGVIIGVHVHESGDATWNVTATYPLQSASDRRAFARLSDEFTRGGDVFVQPDAFQSAASTASERVNRSMSVTDVRRGVAVRNGTGQNATGILTLKFRWNGFANATNGNITVGDAFANGLLGDLNRNETLYIAPPDGYRVTSASSSDQVRNGAIYWHGPYRFDHGGPHVEITTAPDSPFSFGGFGSLAAVAAVAVLVGAGLAYAFVRRSESDAVEGVRTDPQDAGASDPEVSESDGDETRAVAAAVATDDGVEEELLSDEERVEHILDEHGGRMKQAKIVEETRWSNAKVSQILSAMAEDGRVEKLRIGRENLISLPGEGEE